MHTHKGEVVASRGLEGTRRKPRDASNGAMHVRVGSGLGLDPGRQKCIRKSEELREKAHASTMEKASARKNWAATSLGR